MRASYLILNHDLEGSVLLVEANYRHQIRQAVGVAVDISVADDRSDQIGSTGGLRSAYPNQGYFLETSNYPENNHIDPGIILQMIAKRLGVIF